MFIVDHVKSCFLPLLNPLFHYSNLQKVLNWPCTSQKTVCLHQNLFFLQNKGSNNPIWVGRHTKKQSKVVQAWFKDITCVPFCHNQGYPNCDLFRRYFNKNYWKRPSLSIYKANCDLMMVCKWTTLTSQYPLENDHKMQQIFPPGFSSLFFLHVIVMWQGLTANQIAPFHECVVHWFSFNVYFSTNGAKNVWFTRLLFSENWVDHSFFFHVRSAAFYAHFRADTVTSELPTSIPSSRHLFS